MKMHCPNCSAPISIQSMAEMVAPHLEKLTNREIRETVEYDRFNPMPNALPSDLVIQLITNMSLAESIRLLRDEDSRRNYFFIAQQD